MLANASRPFVQPPTGCRLYRPQRPPCPAPSRRRTRRVHLRAWRSPLRPCPYRGMVATIPAAGLRPGGEPWTLPAPRTRHCRRAGVPRHRRCRRATVREASWADTERASCAVVPRMPGRMDYPPPTAVALRWGRVTCAATTIDAKKAGASRLGASNDTALMLESARAGRTSQLSPACAGNTSRTCEIPWNLGSSPHVRGSDRRAVRENYIPRFIPRKPEVRAANWRPAAVNEWYLRLFRFARPDSSVSDLMAIV